MVVTASKMLSLGTSAPDFNLPDTQGNIVSLDNFKEAPALCYFYVQPLSVCETYFKCNGWPH